MSQYLLKQLRKYFAFFYCKCNFDSIIHKVCERVIVNLEQPGAEVQ